MDGRKFVNFKIIATSDVREAILTLLSDGQRHQLTELQKLPFSSESIDATLPLLLQEELVNQHDGFLEKA